MKDANPLTRSYAYSEFLLTLSPKNLDAALAILIAHRSDASEPELRVFMMAWSRFDAPGAFEWARAHETSGSNRLTQAAIFAWAYRDPRAAIAKIEETDEDLKDSVLYAHVIKGWSQNGDVEGLSDYIITMPKTHERLLATAELTKWIAREGIDALIDWAEAVPDDAAEGFKKLAFHEAASTIARRDPERALVWFRQHQGQEYAATTLEMIARRWVDYRDANQLIPRLRALPESLDRHNAIEVAMRWWLHRRPEEAISWLEGLETLSPDLDPAIAAAARYSAKESPRKATIWAAQISDEELRGKALERYGRQWRARNAQELQTWLETSNLSLSEKAAILSGPVHSWLPGNGKMGAKKGKKGKKRRSRRLPH